MDSNLKRTIILENFNNPVNKKLIDDDSYIRFNSNNESCIDNIDIMIKIEDDVIKDIRFDGEACAISTSSTSLMIQKLLYKTTDEAKKIIMNFEKMINEEEYDKKLLEELIVYDEIYKQPNRKKCALLPYVNLKKHLK